MRARGRKRRDRPGLLEPDIGVELLRENRLDEGYKAGQYGFDGTYARSNNEAVRFGQPLAQFLLGLPQSGNIDLTASRANEVVSHGFFVHDDWRVNSRLTLNVGVRYDYERPLTERYDRNTRGFDFTSPSPMTETGVFASRAFPMTSSRVRLLCVSSPSVMTTTARLPRVCWAASEIA